MGVWKYGSMEVWEYGSALPTVSRLGGSRWVGFLN